MGCDIHALVEVWDLDQWILEESDVFPDRNYMWFGFLADVRNRGLKPISAPRGLPADLSDKARDWLDWDYHSHSWLTVKELVDYDYDQAVSDPYGEGMTTVRDLLGERFFEILDYLSLHVGYAGVELSDIRIVFAFDS